MGNQGTKIWTLGAFFVISLMLIAGLFSSTVMAHPDGHNVGLGVDPNHGPGTIAVKLGTVDSDGDFREKRSGKYYFAPEAARQALQFTYEVEAADATDHTFRLQVPTGFTIGNGHVRITEYDIGPADILFQTDRRGNILDDEGEATDEDLTTSDYVSDDDRIEIDLTNDDIVNVEVELGRDWSDGGRLVVIFGNVTVPALANTDGITEGRYTFITRSSDAALEDGNNLNDLDNDDDHLAAQPVVFVSNTDGAGSVGWTVLTLNKNPDGEVVISGTPETYQAIADERADDFIADGIHPGISRVLQFTYTNDVSETVSDKVDADDADEVIRNNNMAGGQVRLEIPRDWTVSKNYIKVLDGAIILYETDDEGFDVAAPDSEDDEDRVKVSASRGGNVSSVTVNLDDAWAEDDADLVVTFGEVSIPSDSGDYVFTTESKGSANGSFTDLDTSPTVKVGNIDPGMGKVTIEPERVYEGQTKVDYTITFEATGPMYNSYVHITVPMTLSEPTTDRETGGDPSEGYVRVSGTGSVRLGIGDLDPVFIVEYDSDGDDITADDNHNIVIAIEEMDSGEKVVVEYDNVTVADGAPANASETQFRVATSTRPLPTTDEDLLGLDASKSYVGIEVAEYSITAVPDSTDNEFVRLFTFADSNDADETDFDSIKLVVLMDGWTYSEAGSGKMAADPKVLEKGSANEDITLTYTADTDLQGLRLNIGIPSGLIETVLTEDRDDGQVTGDGDEKTELAADSNEIRWNRAGKKIDDEATFDTTINNVAITDSTDVYTFTTMVNGDAIGTPGGEGDENLAKVTVVGTGEDVDFEIINLDNDNSIRSPEFPARSMQQIGFRFTLTNTSIEAGGKVSLTLPKDWSKPEKVDDDGEVAKGKTAVGIEGLNNKTTRIDPATPDATDKTDFLVLDTSGQTITVDVKQTLDEGEDITIQYGAEYEVEKDEEIELHIREAMIQADAATGDDKAEITAVFKAAEGMNTYDLDTIEVEVTNIEDGAGSAMINETEINAGSTDQ